MEHLIDYNLDAPFQGVNLEHFTWTEWKRGWPCADTLFFGFTLSVFGSHYSWNLPIQTHLFRISHYFELKTISLGFCPSVISYSYQLFPTLTVLSYFSFPLRVQNGRVQLHWYSGSVKPLKRFSSVSKWSKRGKSSSIKIRWQWSKLVLTKSFHNSRSW